MHDDARARATAPTASVMQPFITDSKHPKEVGTPYSSAGGGEAYFDPAPSNIWSYVRGFISDEGSRKDYSGVMIVGPDLHTRPPLWMEDKNVSIDGTPLSEEQRCSRGYWQFKYRKELDIGQAIQDVKRRKRTEGMHDVIGTLASLRRRLGFAEPLDETHAQQKVKEHYRQLDMLQKERTNAEAAAVDDLPEKQQQQQKQRRRPGLDTPWRVFLESVETGQPLAKVANEYRPSVDFYGLDPFLNSSLSLIWFCTKCGIAIGIAQGGVKAVQAINVDVQFLKASGVGILSILNMSVFANVVKWGGNCALFASAFCLGDRLATFAKYKILPPHDARQRSTCNYAAGLAISGGTVGILPWWILGDVSLAARLSASGVFLGGVLGLAVGTILGRLVAINIARLDATNRELRRYEALMRRQRSWVEKEREKHRRQTYVWW